MKRDEPLDGFFRRGNGLEGGDVIGWHVDSLLTSRASRVIHCFWKEPNRVDRSERKPLTLPVEETARVVQCQPVDERDETGRALLGRDVRA
jgi:hypothetical protein